MGNSSVLLQQLRSCYYSLFDNNGNKRVKLLGDLKNRELSSIKLELLYDLFKLVLDTNMVCDYTKIYIRERDLKVSSIVEDLNNDGVDVTLIQVNNKIQYDKRKLEATFGRDILTHIAYADSYNIDNYIFIINKLLREYFGQYKDNECLLREKLSIEFNSSTISKTRVHNFKDKYELKLLCIMKSTVDMITEQLNSDVEFLGYFNYLISKFSDTDTDKLVQEDKEWLFNLLSSDNKDIEKYFNKLNTLIKNKKFNERLKSNSELDLVQDKNESSKLDGSIDNESVVGSSVELHNKENKAIEDSSIIHQDLDFSNETVEESDNFDFDTLPLEESDLELEATLENKKEVDKNNEVEEFLSSLDNRNKEKNNEKEDNSGDTINNNSGPIKTTRVQF